MSTSPVDQVLPDRDGKRCMFCLKTLSKTYEMSASDTKQRQEWTAGLWAMFFYSVIPPTNNAFTPNSLQTPLRVNI